MKRTITETLASWKHDPMRLPLMIRGARQVGKSFIVQQFGKAYFKNYVEVNFELSPEAKKCFLSLDPADIIPALEVSQRCRLIPEETLLFLDEIQECPNAIKALRYFKEKCPQLHVIAAGSLLEFSMEEETFRMPVGRIKFLYLKPMSFMEYLEAVGHSSLISLIQSTDIHHPLSEAIHLAALREVKKYWSLGGMPAVLNAYLTTGQYAEAQDMQNTIIQTYAKDFGKYANKASIEHLHTLFTKVSFMLGQQIKYVEIDPNLRAEQIKKAIQLLDKAGIITKVPATSATRIPLELQSILKKFKLLFLDIGLATKLNRLDEEVLTQDIQFVQNLGGLAEQFVGQELKAYEAAAENNPLFFWVRDKKDSMAEVDYIILYKHHALPLEVKAGKTGRLKSLQEFIKASPEFFGIRISTNPLEYQHNILSVPFYLISQLPRFVAEIYSG